MNKVNSFGYHAGLPYLRLWALTLLVALLAGCGRDDTQVYRVAKEQPQAQQAQAQPGAMPPGHPDTGMAMPKLEWKTPSGWEEVAPGTIRVASFRVNGKEGKQADVSVIPLPGQAGSDLDNVNRWRGQVGLAPVSAEELTKLAQPVQAGGEPAQLYDMAGQNPGSGEKSRILAAIQRRNGVAWFFKMTGDDALVAEQKPAFVDFLKSLTFTAAPASAPASGRAELPPSHPPIDSAMMAAAQAGSNSAGQTAKPAWQVPSGWREVPGGQFLVAKFSIPGPDNTQANVNVSSSVGAGGGVAGNVNRWRGQLGLNELPEEELNKLLTTVDVPGGKATLVDLSGTDSRSGQKTRLVGAIVPQGSQTWFYKLMGNEEVVAREKDAFTQFVQTAKYTP